MMNINLSQCNLWPMCILVERRMWHESINVMGNYPERGRHSGRDIIKWRLELHVLSYCPVEVSHSIIPVW